MIEQGMKWTKESYVLFQQDLVSLQDEKYLAFNRKLVPTVDNIIGIRVPELRRLAKELKKTDLQAFIQVMDHKYYEENMLHGFVVGELCRDRKLTLEQKTNYIWDFAKYIDNWAVCDSFCSSIKLAKNHPEEMLELIKKALKTEKIYYRRLGFVMLLDHYVNEEYLPMIFQYCKECNMEEYYVQMAVAWLLSMCYVQDKAATLAYLQEGNEDDFTYRKTISKIIESNQVSKEEKQWVRENLKK